MTCRTFTHHVGVKPNEAIRVECVACPRWYVDAVKTGEHSARAVAHAIAAEHEAEDPSVASSSSTPSPGDPSAEHDPRCRLPLPHDRAACLEWARGRVAANRAEAIKRAGS